MPIIPEECGFCIPTICIRSLNLEFILRDTGGGAAAPRWRSTHGLMDMTYCIKEINCRKEGTTSHRKKIRLPPFTPHAPESGLLFAGYDEEGPTVSLDDVNICFEIPEQIRRLDLYPKPDSFSDIMYRSDFSTLTTFGMDLTPKVCCKKIKVGAPPVETDCCTGVKEALCACMNYRQTPPTMSPPPTFPGEDCCATTSWPVSLENLGFRSFSGGYPYFAVPDLGVVRVAQEFSNLFNQGNLNGPSGQELMAKEVKRKIEDELKFFLRFCNYESARGLGGFNPEPSTGTSPEPGPYYPLTYDWRSSCVCKEGPTDILPFDPGFKCP